MFDFRKTKFDEEALRTFMAVAQLHSFSAAADMLHRTTSAISYRIKALENSLGTPLFNRTTRTVTLTPSGEVLLEKAIEIFEWLQKLPEELKQVVDGIEPQFILVINNLLYDADAVALVLEHLHQRFPYTVFTVHRAVYMGVWDAMIYRDGHMAIGVPGFHTINENFLTEPIGIINWVFVVAPGHTLASAAPPLSNDLLRKFPAVNVEDTSLRLSKRTAWRLPGQQEILVPDMHTKLACHLRGFGVGFLPNLIAHRFIERRRLIKCTVTVGRSPSPLSLAWRRQHAGQITSHMRELFSSRDKLIEPFLALMEPVSDQHQ